MTAIPNPEKLTAEEYLRLTENAAERTELRDGEIVAMAPPSWKHQNLSYGLRRSIDDFIRENRGNCRVNEAVGVQLDEHNLVIPDVVVICDPSKIDDKRCHGAPDWVIEVLSTNRSDDLIHKLWLYKEAGVREYWIVDPKNEKTLVYFFEKNDLPDIYTFDTEIPVSIYDRKLSIRIADLV